MTQCDLCGMVDEPTVWLMVFNFEWWELCASCLWITTERFVRYANLRQHLIEIGGDAMIQLTDGFDDWKDRRDLWWGGFGWPI